MAVMTQDQAYMSLHRDYKKALADRAALIKALRECISGMPHNPAQDEAVELLKRLKEWK